MSAPGHRGARLDCVRPRGFALVAALFLLIVLAMLGAFGVRVALSQQQAGNLELLSLRADASARAGVDYAAAQLSATSDCDDLVSPLNLAHGFRVLVDNCAVTPYTVNGATINVFSVTLTASRGAYGSPDFVARSVSVRITP